MIDIIDNKTVPVQFLKDLDKKIDALWWELRDYYREHDLEYSDVEHIIDMMHDLIGCSMKLNGIHPECESEQDDE